MEFPRASFYWIVPLLACAPALADEPCDGERAALVVRDHTLTVCEAGRAVASFPVALGRAGVGKTRDGDNRTPTGRYPLGAPRPSAAYGTFIPVGYPTAEQARRGYRGGAIGVHGPRRGFRFAGLLNAAVDWTRGCIALPTDDAVSRVARFVRAHPGAVISIR